LAWPTARDNVISVSTEFIAAICFRNLLALFSHGLHNVPPVVGYSILFCSHGAFIQGRHVCSNHCPEPGIAIIIVILCDFAYPLLEQVIFNVRVAEKLTAAGHNVTLVLLKVFKFEKERQLQTNMTVLPWEMYVMDWEKESHPEINFKELSVWEARTLLAQKLGIFPASCESDDNTIISEMLKDAEFIERLRAEQFDVAFLPMFDLCTVGIVKHIGIDAWIWLNTGRLMDYVAYYIGLPSPPSYVPRTILTLRSAYFIIERICIVLMLFAKVASVKATLVAFSMMSDLPGNMTFLQRVKSFLGWTMTMLIYERSVVVQENALFRKYIDRNFPDLTEVARMCPLVMVNSDELYDQARPTFHKVINIGGIGMTHGDQKPLEGEFKKIVDEASNVVVMTMGSHAQLSAMPEKWKLAFMNAFRLF
uniref:glucuronosyltransferase n=1 Tax=Ascaris lumbricoides TaxID=6252 RepID=A0A0M3I0X3_ASCLU